MTIMTDVGRRIGPTTLSCLLPTTALAQSATAAASTHDPWALGITALTAVFTASLTLGGGALLARRKDRTSARYLALRIAVLLESYAITCAETLSNHDLHFSSGGHAGTVIDGIEDIPEYPDEEGWSALRPELLERALTLRNQVNIGRGSVASYAEIEVDHDDIASHCAGHYGVCGYMAWTLARDMRRAYRVAPFDPTRTTWDVAPILKGEHDRILRLQGRTRAEHREVAKITSG